MFLGLLDRVINRIRILINRDFLCGHNISLKCVVLGINHRDGLIIAQVLSSLVGTNLTKVLGVVAAFFFDDLNKLDQRWLLGKKTVESPVVPFEGVVGMINKINVLAVLLTDIPAGNRNNIQPLPVEVFPEFVPFFYVLCV